MLLGMPTLGWSMVLFLGTVYIFALIFREALGRGDDTEYVTDMFDTVPRSMYTTFRCSFGDCTSPAGVPIFEHVQEHYGWFWSVLYCGFVYLVTIGLFNVISAIFVEATMKSAADLADKTKQARLQDIDLWSKQVSKLIRRLVRRHMPEPLFLFACSWEEHCSESLKDRLAEARTSMMSDIPDEECTERLYVTDKDGSRLQCAFIF